MKLIHVEEPNDPPCDPFQELAIAVIKQAADDYRSLARKSDESGSNLEREHLQQQMASISRFFFSDWYCALSGFDNGPLILEMLDSEVYGND